MAVGHPLQLWFPSRQGALRKTRLSAQVYQDGGTRHREYAKATESGTLLRHTARVRRGKA
jgi:hypothetical protein